MPPEWEEADEALPETTKLPKKVLLFPRPSGAAACDPGRRRPASAVLSQGWGRPAKNRTAPSVAKAGNALHIRAHAEPVHPEGVHRFSCPQSTLACLCPGGSIYGVVCVSPAPAPRLHPCVPGAPRTDRHAASWEGGDGHSGDSECGCLRELPCGQPLRRTG